MLVSSLNKEIRCPKGVGAPLKRTILRLKNAKAEEHSGEDPKREPENLDLGIRLLGWLPEG